MRLCGFAFVESVSHTCTCLDPPPPTRSYLQGEERGGHLELLRVVEHHALHLRGAIVGWASVAVDSVGVM
jgi:hypothetical protein